MDSQISLSVQLYGVSTALVERSLKDLEPGDFHKRAGDNGNPLIWILGHLSESRCRQLRMLGAAKEIPWQDELFARGSTLDDADKYPSVDVIMSVWAGAGEQLMKRYEELTDEQLSAKAPRDFPVPDKTIRGAINFLAYHEAYHVGQIAYIRKLLDKNSLVG